ncbi:unnamed protein product [Ceratitis capitata]|uniref:(Mediterranean fruit fly) hypothetical protein n=1 Tax=Ceratitis capitata TaxID=7213 RepID=A0A811VID5_CERCA|nr:unnamed protein product [Ceratitis capitata]
MLTNILIKNIKFPKTRFAFGGLLTNLVAVAPLQLPFNVYLDEQPNNRTSVRPQVAMAQVNVPMYNNNNNE